MTDLTLKDLGKSIYQFLLHLNKSYLSLHALIFSHFSLIKEQLEKKLMIPYLDVVDNGINNFEDLQGR